MICLVFHKRCRIVDGCTEVANILQMAYWVLFYVASDGVTLVQLLIDAGRIPHFIHLLEKVGLYKTQFGVSLLYSSGV